MSAVKFKSRWASSALVVLLVLTGVYTSIDSASDAPSEGPVVSFDGKVLPLTKNVPADLVGASIDRASCRIKVDQTKCGGGVCVIESSLGTGTLVAPNRIVSCSHIFNDGGSLSVQFEGKWYPAKLLKRTKSPDLALVEVQDLPIKPTTYVATFNPSGTFYLSGYGGGNYLRVQAKYVGETGGHLVFAPQNRSGDSGGGIFNSAGQLVAVQWGGVDGETYATGGAALVNFLTGTQ